MLAYMRLSVLFHYTHVAPSGHRKRREIHQNQWKRAKIAKNRPWSLLQALLVPPVLQTKRKFSYIPMVPLRGIQEDPGGARKGYFGLSSKAWIPFKAGCKIRWFDGAPGRLFQVVFKLFWAILGLFWAPGSPSNHLILQSFKGNPEARCGV